MFPNFRINGREIGNGCCPYMIAELSANHNGKLENALRIIEQAKLAGADAVKLQTYKPDTITLSSDREEFQIKDGLWAGKTLYSLYEQAHMPWEWHGVLFEYARNLGITIFSSPFDNTAIDLLEDLNAPAYKIASFEAIDLPLIKYAGQTGKPLIISTGMADKEEIQEAIDAAKSAGCKELAILHCVSGYPAPADDYNLITIKDMQSSFQVPVGLSDHTLDNTTAIASIALGACIIEKHVTMDRNGGGPDDSFSLEPDELERLCTGTRVAWKAMGNVDYGRKSSEEGNIKFRRSLYFMQNVKAGEKVSEKNVKSIRPGYGLPPKYLEEILGKVVKTDVKRGMPVSFELIEK
ncbi:pseudaminic acid synthase [Candidatus Tenderia electrophaga]|jgi:N-acetylneuraminate synthase|uniref:Pseudaminic acid synthase n=1 Tax=Candidatus Tenderia electrophaga TaxID=1748243 RepID=A0A0S2TDH2_9GAMM|nr:pseudaminic acid synthase [Candidatus Tenderia electrophaga]